MKHESYRPEPQKPPPWIPTVWHYGAGGDLRQAYAAAWLGVKRNEVSPSTYSAYRHVSGSLVKFLGPKADGDLAEIAPADLAAFRNRQAATLSPATASRHVKIVRMLFDDALKDQAIDFDAAVSLETVRNARKAGGNERRAFSIAEIRALLAVADPEWRSLIKFGLYTGQRLGDLAALSNQFAELLVGAGESSRSNGA